jgi:UDP:flavonoid glycosyltransferase YjiC (YdhE family)
MRVLVNSIGSAGHVMPLISLARAARDRGHEIRFAVEPPLANLPEARGFATVALPTTAEVADPVAARRAQQHRRSLAGRERVRAALASFVERSRVGAAALMDEIESFRPEVILRDQAAFGGWAAAEAAGIPAARPSFFPSGKEVLASLVAEPMADLRAAVGLDPDPDLASLDPPLHILGGPPGWYDTDRDLGPNGLLIQPPVHLGDTIADLPREIRDLEPPVVYVTPGTVAGDATALLDEIFEALDSIAATVITTTRHPTASLGSRVLTYDWLPQVPLMNYVDAVVAHGGYGTIMTALCAGIPVLSIPLPMLDNRTNAKRLEATGAGLILTRADLSPEKVRSALKRLLEPEFRSAAAKVGEAIRGLPGTDAAVDALASIAGQRRRATRP